MRAEAKDFLARTPWHTARMEPLAGDASLRGYARLIGGPKRALLMDADPAKGEDVGPFIRISRHLTAATLPAPQIYEADESSGFLVIEDFGNLSMAAAAQDAPQQQMRLYERATDHIVAFATLAPLDGLPAWDSASMAPLSDLAVTWYAPGRPSPTGVIRTALAPFDDTGGTFVHRDYHAENLMVRPGDGPLGIIDFQDAALGHPSYDLASLIHDVRRDVPADIAGTAIRRVTAALDLDRETFEAALAAHSAQRALRILGVFARLRIRDGKPRYLEWLPRTWRILREACTHPHLAEVRRIVDELPAPTPEHLRTIEARCHAPA
ncbi:MAG: aminoglycoside phosphotransferase family protein [Shimia sp.]